MDDDQDTNTAPGEGDPRTGASSGPGAEQFQRAALDAVRAARALLDAAEKVLADPAALDSVVRAAAGMARNATETVAGFASAAASSGRRDDNAPGNAPDTGSGGDEPGQHGGFESIRID